MSIPHGMSDEPYTNLDLQTAEDLLRAAGKPELAEALSHHAYGVRNLVQGEWGRSFVASLESILGRHIQPLIDAQKETHSGIAALSVQFHAIASDVAQLKERMRESQQDRAAIHQELDVIRAQLTQIQQAASDGEVG